jgi:hypothetical protein
MACWVNHSDNASSHISLVYGTPVSSFLSKSPIFTFVQLCTRTTQLVIWSFALYSKLIVFPRKS